MSKGHDPTDASPDGSPPFLAKQINSAKLGVDGDGFRHHYWRGADTVVAYDENGVDHVEPLNGSLLATWVKFVEEKRGWKQKGTFADPLIEADRWRKEQSGTECSTSS
jgi:hypothetical protein